MQERKIELDTLISLAEKEKDYDSIFHYLTMLLNTKDYNKILSVINKNKDGLAKFDQIGLMDIHFYALLQLERFVDAMDEIRYYEDLPYVSQEVEEHVRDLRNIVKGYEEETKIIHKFKNKKKTNDIIRYSTNQEEVLQAIQYAAYAKNYKDYVDSLIYLIEDKERDLPHTIKAITLTYLAGLRINKKVHYTNFGIEYELIPSEMVLFKDDPLVKKINQYLNELSKNITIINTASKILDTYYLLSYPLTNICEDNTKLFAVALLKIGAQFLQDDDSLSEVIKEHNLSEQRVDELVNIINEIIAIDAEPSYKN